MSGVLDDLTEDEQAALVDLAKAKANGGLSRRDMIKLAGIGGVGALIGAGGTQAVGTAQADSGQSGTVGTQANPQDLYTQDIYAPLGDVLLNDSVDAQGNDLTSVGSIDTEELNLDAVVDPDESDWKTALENAVSKAPAGGRVIVPPDSWDCGATPLISKSVFIDGLPGDDYRPDNRPTINFTADVKGLEFDNGVNGAVRGLYFDGGGQTHTSAVVEHHDKVFSSFIIGNEVGGPVIYMNQAATGDKPQHSRAMWVSGRIVDGSVVKVENTSGDGSQLNAIRGLVSHAVNCTGGAWDQTAGTSVKAVCISNQGASGGTCMTLSGNAQGVVMIQRSEGNAATPEIDLSNAVNSLGVVMFTGATNSAAIDASGPGCAGFRVPDMTWEGQNHTIEGVNFIDLGGDGSQFTIQEDSDNELTIFSDATGRIASIDPAGNMTLAGSLTENGSP